MNLKNEIIRLGIHVYYDFSGRRVWDGYASPFRAIEAKKEEIRRAEKLEAEKPCNIYWNTLNDSEKRKYRYMIMEEKYSAYADAAELAFMFSNQTLEGKL